MAKTVFCAGEGRDFPEDEFLFNKDGTIFKPHIHKVFAPHYAMTGETLGASHGIPGPLVFSLGQLLTKMSVADVHSWIEQKNESVSRGTGKE
jgi:hypothetical protein